jgi:hypothetical protein
MKRDGEREREGVCLAYQVFDLMSYFSQKYFLSRICNKEMKRNSCESR